MEIPARKASCGTMCLQPSFEEGRKTIPMAHCLSSKPNLLGEPQASGDPVAKKQGGWTTAKVVFWPPSISISHSHTLTCTHTCTRTETPLLVCSLGRPREWEEIQWFTNWICLVCIYDAAKPSFKLISMNNTLFIARTTASMKKCFFNLSIFI